MHPEPYFPEPDFDVIDADDARDPRRSFNTAERAILFARQNGRCALCDIVLQPGWPADHVIPWSLGGPTHVDNGQALCHDCNNRKSNSTEQSPYDLRRTLGVVGPWPEQIQPREWAVRFLEDYRTHARRDYLLVATPGAGKTLATLAAIHGRFTRGEIDRVVIVAPTDVVRGQWMRAAAQVGIQLAPVFLGLPLPRWLNGVAITYQALLTSQHRLAELCATERVMVVLDEVHHAADTKAWGHALSDALSDARGAAFRLSLSGTPFRTDGTPIVGLRLERDPQHPRWFNVPQDFTYGYLDGLLEGDVVREVFFPGFDGQMTWQSRYAPDDVQVASFADQIERGEAQQRLRTFLWPHADALPAMLQAADNHLTALREAGDPRAQALVIGIDQAHADHIRALLARITGTDPTVVTSDTPGGHQALRNFGDGDGRWLVAVRMVSEGYDNRRLRVGVYASTWTTEMFFRQFVGRFVRYNSALGPMLQQPAFVYLPNDERLLRVARSIRQEQAEATRIRSSRTAEGWAGDEVVDVTIPRRPGLRDPARAFHPLGANAGLVAVEGPDGTHGVVGLTDTQAWLDRAQVEPVYFEQLRLRRRLDALIRRTGMTPEQAEAWLATQREAAA